MHLICLYGFLVSSKYQLCESTLPGSPRAEDNLLLPQTSGSFELSKEQRIHEMGGMLGAAVYKICNVQLAASKHGWQR